jgi:hypothetical protein
MNDNNFTALFKTWTTDKLFDIVDNPNDYQPLAVETARLELDCRQLTPEQIANAKAEQDLRQQDIANKQQRVNDIEDKVKSVVSSLVDNLNPIQKEAPTTDKYIKIISLFLGGLLLYNIYSEFGLLQFMFSEETVEWDFSTMIIFLSWIILPTAGILFWLRKKLGWTLAAIYFSYTAGGAFAMFVTLVNNKPSVFQSPTDYLYVLILFASLLWVICKDEIKEIYKIDKQTMYLTTIGVGVLTALGMFMYIYHNKP